MILDEDCEKEDFIELIINTREYIYLSEKGVVGNFINGLNENRNLNVFIRVSDEKKER